jgi:hypothetical protein
MTSSYSCVCTVLHNWRGALTVEVLRTAETPADEPGVNATLLEMIADDAPPYQNHRRGISFPLEELCGRKFTVDMRLPAQTA